MPQTNRVRRSRLNCYKILFNGYKMMLYNYDYIMIKYYQGYFPSFPASCPFVTAVGGTMGPNVHKPEVTIICITYYNHYFNVNIRVNASQKVNTARSIALSFILYLSCY